MSNYSIRDLEQLSGIKAHTLRIWEQRYGILNPDRTDTNIRTYDDNDLKLVLNISLLKDHEYKISEIAKMSAEEMRDEVMKISNQHLNYPDQIHALTLSMLDLDEERFEKIINTNTLQFGFENMMIHIIYPFLARIGTLWITGSIGPAQEHFISNLIRQKIIVAIDGQLSALRPDAKKFLLYLPEGELHEIGLLFAYYIFKSRRNKVIYLGQHLPFEEIGFAHKNHLPDAIFVSITSSPGPEDVQEYVTKLCNSFPDTKVYLTGYQIVGQDIETPENGMIINNVRDLMEVASE
jgi:MerR family transcriptional regulator, light-induced transcriptional regulator